jgi:hypothetical protein
MNFLLFLLFSLLFFPSVFTQVEGPNPVGTPGKQQHEGEAHIPPPKIETDDYYEKFQQLITEFDQSMENMNPDDIITFALKQGFEEVIIIKFYLNF